MRGIKSIYTIYTNYYSSSLKSYSASVSMMSWTLASSISSSKDAASSQRASFLNLI